MKKDFDFDSLMPFKPLGELSANFFKKAGDGFDSIRKATSDFTKSSPATTPIPKIIHFIWLGPRTYPEFALEILDEWIALNPSCECMLWVDSYENYDFQRQGVQIKKLGVDFSLKHLQKEYDAHPTYAGKSDILRLELLYEFGGFYTDYDNRCIRSIELLLECSTLLCAFEWEFKLDLFEDPVSGEWIEPRISNCILGAAPGLSLFEQAFARMKRAHDFFLKSASFIKHHQITVATYVHWGLAVASYILAQGSVHALILPSKLCWGHIRGCEVSLQPERFFEIAYLESVGWKGEKYDWCQFKHVFGV